MDHLDIRQLRAATKGTADRIHFNNAGASLPPDAVVETVIAYLKEEAIYGGYETEARYQQPLENVYHLIAKLINATTEEVAVVENASTAWHLAFNGIGFEKGDEIITSEMEYVTNLIGFLNVQRTQDVRIKVVPQDESGNFSLPALEEAISARTKLIAITHLPSTAGNILPVADIGRIARQKHILYLVDACQSVGQLPLDVKDIGCDMLSVTGRKYLRAPRGTGFLYVRKEIQDRLKLLFMDGRSTAWVSENEYKVRDDARRFELYEKNRALVLGLGTAIAYALDLGPDRTWRRIHRLSALFREKLTAIEGVILNDKGDQLSGIVTFSVAGIHAADIKEALAKKNINVSVGNAASTLAYMNRHHLTSIVRASVHYYNTEEEIDSFCSALTAILSPSYHS